MRLFLRVAVAAALAAAGLALVAGSSASDSGLYKPANTYAAGANPTDFTLADLNSDGVTDMAVSNRRANQVSVLLGNGDGTFKDPVAVASVQDPTAILAQDFNYDGFTDLAVADAGQGTVSILSGNEDGTFADPVTYDTGPGGPTDIASADANGDGYWDIIATSSGAAGDSNISVFLGSLEGTFGAPVVSGTGIPGAASLAVDYLGPNGNEDLAVVENTYDGTNCTDTCGVTMMLGQGDGTFTAGDTYPAGMDPGDVTLGDLTGDGLLDLAVDAGGGGHGENDYVIERDGLGDGSFGDPTPYLADNPGGIAIADLDGDGNNDLAVVRQIPSNNVPDSWGGSPGVLIRLGSGDGTLGNPRVYPTVTHPTALELGNLDLDGGIDLVTAHPALDEVSVLLPAPPDPPVITRSDPVSPGGSTTPSLFGTAPPNSSVSIYAADDCSGQAVGGDTADVFGNEGIQVDVAADTSTTFTATVTTGNGATSGCSQPFTYVETSQPDVSFSWPEVPFETGDSVTFMATAVSSDEIADYAWDLDGNGSYETDTGTDRTATTTYSEAGPVDVSVKATAASGKSGTATKTLTVLLAPPPGPIGVTIDDGAIFTNTPHVSVNAVWPDYTRVVKISNDGGFHGAHAVAPADSIDWTLQSSGSERLPKTVYVRFDNSTQTFSDDIILDESAPQTKATLRGHKLHVTVRDGISGVSKVQVRRGHKIVVTKHYGHRRGKQKISKTLHVRGKKLYVRAFDAAGNRSHWHKARRAR